MVYQIFVQLFKLLVFDAIVAGIFLTIVSLIKRVKCASYAVLARDFVGYFSNPTGYVFICVFMMLSALCAFWPEEFFNANLANLDQLNKYIPLVLLVFIPAITMSVWSEEQREGTDELLLTIPASDVDIVLGKYLAAVAVFSVALFLSQLSNFLVLLQLSIGDVDVGLFISTFIGYWFMGIAMLALGMAASFLTGNLTVSFVLGVLVNVPLVLLRYAESAIPGRDLAQGLSWWSYQTRFSDFGRGVISWASISFFVLIAALGVYLSIILIGRRHWQGGRDGRSLAGHYLVRLLAIVAIAFGASKFFSYHDWFRYDATNGKVSSLSPDTREILHDLDAGHTVVIDAFVSRTMPEQYVKTKVDLVNMLRAFDALAGANIAIRLNDDLDTFTKEAQRAEEQFGITPQTVMIQSRGSIKQEELFLGAAFSCGLERVVIPFFDRGIPVEYELVRSIATVTNAKRLKIGVVKTDAGMFGSFDMFRQRPKQLIIQELEKQYDVEEVELSDDPLDQIEEGVYDVLMVVQPSSLTEPALRKLIATIRNGQPTAIFEDPFPAMMRSAPATSQPRQAPGGPMAMFGGGGQPVPKGNIRELWDVLGIDMVSGDEPAPGGLANAEVVWQKYNPYENKIQIANITPEWVFINPDAPGAGADAFNSEDTISSGLSQLLFLFPGAVRDMGTRKLEFTPLVMTGDESGQLSFDELKQFQGNPQLLEYSRMQGYTKKRYIVGARIRGKLRGDFQMSDAGSPLLAQVTVPRGSTAAKDASKSSPDKDDTAKASDEKAVAEASDRDPEVHVVYVSDIDLLSSEFMALRSQPDEQIGWEFDNVTFVLNILDSLAGDERLMEIRKRKTRHSTLKMVNQQTEDARAKALEEISGFKGEFEGARQEAQDRMDKAVAKVEEEYVKLQAQSASGGADTRRRIMEVQQRIAVVRQTEQMKFDAEIERLEEERDRKLKKIDRDMKLGIRKVQSGYKLFAVLPIFLPLLIGLGVWGYRSGQEKKGVAATRLR